MTRTIAIIDHTTLLSESHVKVAAAALQVQLNRDFAPEWGTDATLVIVPKGSAPPAGAWLLALFDTSDQAGALGYHDTTAYGLPVARVFVKSALLDGTPWTVTASHELLEMLADPDDAYAVFDSVDGTTGTIMTLEVCDPCEDEHYSINGVAVSDFVTRHWFVRGSRGPYDYLRRINKPLGILSGGYMGVNVVGSAQGWRQAANIDTPGAPLLLDAQHAHADPDGGAKP